MNNQFIININNPIFQDKQQRIIKEFLFSCSLFCKELLLRNTKYYSNFVSIVSYYKLKVLEKVMETKTKKDKKIGTVQYQVEVEKYFTDAKFNRTKITKIPKTVSDKKTTATEKKPVKEPKVTVLSTEYFTEGDNKYKKEEQEVVPEKFMATKKPFHNFFSMCIELYINDIIDIFAGKDYDENIINTHGTFSKFVKYIADTSSIETKFLQIEFEQEYNNKIFNKFNTIKNSMFDVINECFNHINKISINEKKYLCNILITFIYNIWADVCALKVGRIEKKMYYDINTLFEVLFTYYLKSNININLHEIKELFLSKEDEINTATKNKKNKNKHIEILQVVDDTNVTTEVKTETPTEIQPEVTGKVQDEDF